MTASTLTYPLDLIRTRLSINTQSGAQLSMLGVAKQIYGEGGIRGMYRGLGATLFGITPYIGIKMATFDILKTIVGNRDVSVNT